ncbi:MAG: tetratricopeptide repeat protein [Paracoccaceae bacterium]
MRRKILAMLAFLMVVSDSLAKSSRTEILSIQSAPAQLILSSVPKNGWIVQKEDSFVTIQFPKADFEIDISRIFLEDKPLVLKDLSTYNDASGAWLRFFLDCDCDLVIDSNDGESLSINVVGAQLLAGPTIGNSGPAPAIAPFPHARRGEFETQSLVQGIKRRPDVGDVQHRLFSQLERAAAAGIISFRQADISRGSEIDNDLSDTDALSSQQMAAQQYHNIADDAKEIIILNSISHFEERNAIHWKFFEKGNTMISTNKNKEAKSTKRIKNKIAFPKNGCPEKKYFQFFRNTNVINFDLFQKERNFILRNFETITKDDVHILLEYYLIIDFGIEAFQLFAELELEGSDKDVMFAMANVSSGSPTNIREFGPLHCTDFAALWQARAALLSNDSDTAMDAAHRSGSAIDILPRRQREIIAANIGLAALNSLGGQKTAKDFFLRARRAVDPGEEASSVLKLLEARLAIEDGDLEHGFFILEELWGEQSEIGQKATVIIAETLLDDPSQPVVGTRNLQIDLGAIGREMRQTTLGRRAIIAEARLAARASGQQAGMGILATALSDGLLAADQYRDAVDLVRRERPDQGDKTPLALLYEESPEQYSLVLDKPSFRAALVRSYAEIGAPERGESFLRKEDQRDMSLMAVLADAYLDVGELKRAAPLVRSLPLGPKRDRLEARRLARENEPAQALAVLAEANAPEGMRARLAWEAGEWIAASEAIALSYARNPNPRIATRLVFALQRAGLGLENPVISRILSETSDEAQNTLRNLSWTSAKSLDEQLQFIQNEVNFYRDVLQNGQ